MKITRPSLKKAGFVITSYGCRYGKIPFLIYRKHLIIFPRCGIKLNIGKPILDLVDVSEIDDALFKKIEILEKILDEQGITLLSEDELLNEYPFEKK